MKKIHTFILIIGAINMISCQKYLDEKPDKSLIIPKTVADLQAVLDNRVFMNDRDASFGEASADDYYLPQPTYNMLRDYQKEAYTWQNKHYTYSSQSGNDWGMLYDVVYFCNLALQYIEQMPRVDSLAWNNVKGSALFYRSQTYLHTVWLYSKTYDKSTAESDYGIVLRTSPDFNVPSVRASLEDTYTEIISDFKLAASLLPAIPQHVTRPSKPAAYAYLARTYLSMRMYDSAWRYADLVLQLKNELMDYNDPSIVDINSSTRPFRQFNGEVIFQKIISIYSYTNVYPSVERVDTTLYNSYDENDLRKTAFFRQAAPGYYFKGTYNGNRTSLFTGVATDEVILIRAECEARLNNISNALEDLNTLMKKRWKSGFFVPYSASSSQEALEIILAERRKELIFRGLRWMDLKRLNKEGANILITRNVDGTQYILPPNDNRYALPLPDDIISEKVPQNKY